MWHKPVCLCLIQLWHSAGSLASLFPHAVSGYGSRQSFWIQSAESSTWLLAFLPKKVNNGLCLALPQVDFHKGVCLHTELESITLCVVVCWLHLVLLLFSKGHGLQIHWTELNKKYLKQGMLEWVINHFLSINMGNKQLLPLCLKCQKKQLWNVLPLSSEEKQPNSCHFCNVKTPFLKKHLMPSELRLAGANLPP